MLERIDTLIAFAAVMLGVSLLITIINQMIASLLGHRATYLRAGIKDLLETLDPALKPNLEKITDDVLTHKLATDSAFAHVAWAPRRWKLASTIRPEELAKLLKLVSAGQPYAANVQAILNEVNPTVAREAQLIAATINTLAPTAAASADELIRQVSDKATKAIGRLEGAFSSTMDRVRQRFTLQMRVWTIVFSLIFAFAYHLDVAKIYSQLSIDPSLRASLSNISSDLMKKYSEVAAPQTPAAGTEMRADTTSDQATKDLEDGSNKLAAAYKDIKSKLADPKLAIFEVPRNWTDFGGLGGIFRILATAAFLSLGAPFWYNTLRSLTSLRSKVAEQMQAEAKS